MLKYTQEVSYGRLLWRRVRKVQGRKMAGVWSSLAYSDLVGKEQGRCIPDMVCIGRPGSIERPHEACNAELPALRS